MQILQNESTPWTNSYRWPKALKHHLQQQLQQSSSSAHILLSKWNTCRNNLYHRNLSGSFVQQKVTWLQSNKLTQLPCRKFLRCLQPRMYGCSTQALFRRPSIYSCCWQLPRQKHSSMQSLVLVGHPTNANRLQLVQSIQFSRAGCCREIW